MSHFTVMVIGENPEEQLAPYDESLKVEQVTDEDGDTYWDNPKAKWDWYQLGGRWTGFFKLKSGKEGVVGNPGVMTLSAPEGYADSALKKDIDFEGMRREKRYKAEERYNNFHIILGQYPNTQSFKDVEKLLGTDVARATYSSQRGIKALREAGFDDIFCDIMEEYNIPRDDYISRAENRAVSTYAFVKDGKWFGKGEMMMFGFSANEMDENEWLSQFNKMLNELPDDTLISVYDCHI